VHTLSLTESAQPVLRLIWSAIGETYVAALQGLSTDEIGIMVNVLERVHSNLSACKPLGAEPIITVGNDATARRGLRLVR
jgi:hypothetical protein